MTFDQELEQLIVTHNMHATSETSASVLAEYLFGCLVAWNLAIERRTRGQVRAHSATVEQVRKVLAPEDPEEMSHG